MSSESELLRIAKIMQRVQRQCTGYYCGYTFKAQPTGKKYLRGVAESLNYMTAGLEDKTAGQQWHRITHRMLTDLQHRVMKRTAPEEWNLAAYYHEHDITRAEFLRTYDAADFKGRQLVQRLEDEVKKKSQRVSLKVIPTAADQSKQKWFSGGVLHKQPEEYVG